MSDPQHGFDEALLSGYVDSELTQVNEQQVRVHVEDCTRCRDTLEELRRIKETTMATDFRVPDDTQWDETPRSAASRFLRDFGWLTAVAYLVGIVAYLLWQITTDSESFRLEAVLGFALWLAFGLIILAALIDRLKTRKTDPYRKVKK